MGYLSESSLKTLAITYLMLCKPQIKLLTKGGITPTEGRSGIALILKLVREKYECCQEN